MVDSQSLTTTHKRGMNRMFTHIVFFKLKDRSPESVKVTYDVLKNMEGRIPQLRYIDVGMDVLHQGRSFDIALITRFDSLEDLNAYDMHPVHMVVKEHMGQVLESSASVDYES